MSSNGDDGTENMQTDVQSDSPSAARKKPGRRKKIRHTEELKIDQTLRVSDVPLKKQTKKTRRNDKVAFLPKIHTNFEEYSRQMSNEESTSSEPEKLVKKRGRRKKRVSKDKENVEPAATSETDKLEVESVKNRRGRSRKVISSPEDTNKEIKTVFIGERSETEENSKIIPSRHSVLKRQTAVDKPIDSPDIKQISPSRSNPVVTRLKSETLEVRRSLTAIHRSKQSILKKRRSKSLENTPALFRKSVRFNSTQPNRVHRETYNKEKEETFDQGKPENISIISVGSSPETIDITTPTELKKKISLRNATPITKRSSTFQVEEDSDSPNGEISEDINISYRRSFRNKNAIKLFTSEDTCIENLQTLGKLSRSSTFTKDSPKMKKTPNENDTIKESLKVDIQTPRKLIRSSTLTHEDTPETIKTPKKSTTKEIEEPKKAQTPGCLIRYSTFTNEDSPKVKKTPTNEEPQQTLTVPTPGMLKRSSTFTKEDSPKVKKITRKLWKIENPCLKIKETQPTPNKVRKSSIFNQENSPDVKKSRKTWNFEKISPSKNAEKVPELSKSLMLEEDLPIIKKTGRKTWNKEPPVTINNKEKSKTPEKLRSCSVIKGKTPKKSITITTTPGKPTRSSLFVKESSPKTKKTPIKSVITVENLGSPGKMLRSSILTNEVSPKVKKSDRKSTKMEETPEKLRSTMVIKGKTPKKFITATTTPGKPTRSLLFVKESSPKTKKTPMKSIITTANLGTPGKMLRSSILTNEVSPKVKKSSRKSTKIEENLNNEDQNLSSSNGKRKSASFTIVSSEENEQPTSSFTIASGEINIEENLTEESTNKLQTKKEEHLPGPSTRKPQNVRKSSSFTIGEQMEIPRQSPKRKSSSFTVSESMLMGVTMPLLDNITLSLDDSIKLFGENLEKAKSPEKILKEAAKALNLSKQVTPFLKRLQAKKIQTPPSGTSTPKDDKREKIFKKVETQDKRLLIKDTSANSVSTKKIQRTKIPNFALIHQRELNKVENIIQMKERKIERAKMLLSGQKPTLGIKISPKNKKSKKMLEFLGSSGSSNEQSQYNGTPKAIRTNVANISKIKNSSNVGKIKKSPIASKIKKSPIAGKIKKSPVVRTVNPKSHIPVARQNNPVQRQKTTAKQTQAETTRFGFKAKQNPSKKEQVRAIATKSKLIRNSTEHHRNLLSGFRSNRRFELLMAMRNKK